MKKAIVLSTALLLAGAAAFAADVKFSGRIRAGYNFQFGDNNMTSPKKTPEGRLNLSIKDADGLWNITFDAAPNGSTETGGYSDHYYRAKATVALDKALKNAGVDLGDVTLSAFGGYYDWYETKNVYNDGAFSDNDIDRMDLNVASQSKEASIVGVDVGYGKLAMFQLVSAPVSNTGVGKAFAFTATSMPADGVQVGVGYGHNVRLSNGLAKLNYNNAISASANVDVAKMSGSKDFSLGVATNLLLGLEDKDYNQNSFFQVLGRVNGGVDAVDGYLEYGFAKLDVSGSDPVHYLRAQANLNMIEGIGLDVYYQDSDLGNLNEKNDFELGAEASYSFGGVTYHLDVAYCAEKDNNNIKLTPWVQIAF